MGNYIYLTAYRNFNIDELREQVNTISKIRFKGLLSAEIEEGGIHLSFPIFNTSLSIWIDSPRKIRSRHEYTALFWWVQNIIFNDLALLYNGRLSDDGAFKTWKPINKPPFTFDEHLDNRYGANKNTKLIHSVVSIEIEPLTRSEKLINIISPSKYVYYYYLFKGKKNV